MGLPQSIIDKWREELGEPVKVIETDTKLIIKKENGNKVVDFDKKSDPFLFYYKNITQFDSFAETVNYIKKFWDESTKKKEEE